MHWMLMVWYPTRMTNLLDCCLHIVNILVPLCDTLVSCAIKKEEAAYFMSLMCFSILHVMAELQALFVGSILKILDTDSELLIELFNNSERMTDVHENLRTHLHDSFLAGLSKDGNGNFLFMNADSSGEKHTIMPRVSSHTNRANKSKIERVIDESKDIKEKTISNLTENIKDQNQRNTIVEFASTLDLARKRDKVIWY